MEHVGNDLIAAGPPSDNYGSQSTRRRRVVALYGGFCAIFPLYALAFRATDSPLKLAFFALAVGAFGEFIASVSRGDLTRSGANPAKNSFTLRLECVRTAYHPAPQ